MKINRFSKLGTIQAVLMTFNKKIWFDSRGWINTLQILHNIPQIKLV